MTKYFLRAFSSISEIPKGEWKEVEKKDWISAERSAGFWPKGLMYNEDSECTIPATGGFSGNGIEGKLEGKI